MKSAKRTCCIHQQTASGCDTTWTQHTPAGNAVDSTAITGGDSPKEMAVKPCKSSLLFTLQQQTERVLEEHDGWFTGCPRSNKRRYRPLSPGIDAAAIAGERSRIVKAGGDPRWNHRHKEALSQRCQQPTPGVEEVRNSTSA